MQYINRRGPKKISKEMAFQKIKSFCGYQERCQSETKERLRSMGLGTVETEELISRLIDADYLNEARFAILFAGRKFRTKHWGKVKIRYTLQQKRISDPCITRALEQIDEQSYSAAILRLANKKFESLSAGPDQGARKRKTSDYLLQKGYEPALVFELTKTF